ncbi:hypothetical protein [Phycicoccus avicenniae]|uniref:hypothetical protein n=1 Tax=Phycicoccus avicenniae TaxID=2828860 RepID=UPI003D2D485D
MCKYLIFSTGDNSEAAAKEAKKLVDRCPHGEKTIDPLVAAESHLDKAERLIDAAASLSASSSAAERAELLVMAEDALSDETTLRALDELLMQASTQKESATRALGDLKRDGDDAEAVLDRAEHEVKHAKAGLRGARSAFARALKERAASLLARISELRTVHDGNEEVARER